MSWERNVRRVTPYTPGEQPKYQAGIIKLNTNENPYPPAPGVGRVLQAADSARLRLYPDPQATVLVDAIAAAHELSPSQVFAGVGSDDVLSMAFMTFFHGDLPILFPDVTYSFYDVWAQAYRIPYKKIPLAEDWHIRAEDYRLKNGGIVFPNPNAPTGVLEPLSLIETILEENPDSVVIVDEAYIDFGGVSSLPLLERYENLLIVRTFSKSRSLAGLRVGYALGSEKLIRCLQDIKFSINSYTLTNMACQCAAASLKDEAYFSTTVQKIISTREAAKARFAALGFTFPESFANFIFVSHSGIPASRLYEELRARNIFVRYWDKDRIREHLRVTVGTPEEMDCLFAALSDIFGK